MFPGREQTVLAVVEGRDPDTHAFDRLPSNMDIHSYRRRFAQELYEYLSGRPLLPKDRRLQAADFDKNAAREVSRYKPCPIARRYCLVSIVSNYPDSTDLPKDYSSFRVRSIAPFSMIS